MAKIELLAPSGNMDCLVSAIKAGCDAVYLGGRKFGARSYSDNFDLEELEKAIKLCHFYDVKVYVTCNTLIYEEEFEECVNYIGEIHKLGVDAVLIQDLGLLEYLSKVYPNLVLHASTQMNVTTLKECELLKSLGVKRIVLGRETEIEEIKKIKENLDIEIEVFVHGALCVSYSGNCYMSSMNGARSGNRGKCAGNCRLEYKLVSDNGYESDYNYPLSSKDLCTIDKIKELIKIGVDSLKIEGRMKRPEYVSQVVSSYRKAIDFKGDEKSFKKMVEEETYKMKLIFNREFTKGFMFNENNNDWSNPMQPNHIGINVGKTIKSIKNSCYIKLKHPLSNGDSIRFVRVFDDLKTQEIDAITINDMMLLDDKTNKEVLVKEANSNSTIKVKTHKIIPNNCICYITSSKKQLDELNKLKYKKVKINGIITLLNNTLSFTVYDKSLKVTKEVSHIELSNSQNNKRIIEQLTKTNNIYEYSNIVVKEDNNYFLPISLINKLRTSVLDEYKTLKENQKIEYKKCSYSYDLITLDYSDKPLIICNDRLSINEIEGLKESYKDFEIVKYNDILVRHKNSLNDVIRHNYANEYRNITNSYSCYMYHKLGINRLVLSIELNEERIKNIVTSFKARYNFNPNLSVLLYSRYELMLLKYCPINKSHNLKSLNCKMCVNDNYYLVDRKNNKYPLKRDSLDFNERCHLLVLDKDVCNISSYSDELISFGINSFVFDFSLSTLSEIDEVIKEYKNKTINKKQYYGHFHKEVL